MMQKPAGLKTLPDQQEILQRISEGDEKAYVRFFNHYYALLWPFVVKFTKSVPDAEEVLQDTFVRVWLYRDKIQEIEHINAWIFKVTSRECLSFLRKSLSDRENLTGLDDSREFPELKGTTPLDKVQLTEISRAVTAAVDQMPTKRKRIYKMSRDEGLKPSEIADQLSLSVSTVKNVLSHCLKEIRSYLIRAGFDFMLLFLLCI